MGTKILQKLLQDQGPSLSITLWLPCRGVYGQMRAANGHEWDDARDGRTCQARGYYTRATSPRTGHNDCNAFWTSCWQSLDLTCDIPNDSLSFMNCHDHFFFSATIGKKNNEKSLMNLVLKTRFNIIHVCPYRQVAHIFTKFIGDFSSFISSGYKKWSSYL